MIEIKSSDSPNERHKRKWINSESVSQLGVEGTPFVKVCFTSKSIEILHTN